MEKIELIFKIKVFWFLYYKIFYPQLNNIGWTHYILYSILRCCNLKSNKINLFSNDNLMFNFFILISLDKRLLIIISKISVCDFFLI